MKLFCAAHLVGKTIGLEKQIVEVGTVVLGLAASHAVNGNDSRYVELIRLHITTN